MIECGTKATVSRVVTETLTAAAAGSGTLPVFGTPYLAALMENAAWVCVQPFLEEGCSTVGTHIDVSHDAPTPVGLQVFAEAEVIAVEGGKLTFALRAWDERGPIGSGSHTRVIVDNIRFLQKSNSKHQI